MNFQKQREALKGAEVVVGKRKKKGKEIMVAAGVNIKDELLPELEMSITPCKLTDNVRVDLFRFDDTFMDFLVQNGCIKDDVHNDTHFMSMSQAMTFCKRIRDMYKTFNARKVANAHV